MHALIIEDESLIAMAIEDVLRDCGFTSFDVAATARDAIGAAARRSPSLITADVELRPGCGIQAVRSICCERPIPVVFITGSPAEVRTRMPGHALILKPFGADHVIAAVRLVLEAAELPWRSAISGVANGAPRPARPNDGNIAAACTGPIHRPVHVFPGRERATEEGAR